MESKKRKLTQARLKELLDYDPETGIFTRKVTTDSRAMAGDIIKNKDFHGYLYCRVDGRHYRCHRLAFLFMEGYFPENEVDHIDRDPLNNSWNNLREVSHLCNMRNRCVSKNNKSGVTGVSWVKPSKKWKAYIKVNGKTIYIGIFKTKIDAVKARWEAEVKHEFPNCNTTSSAYEFINKSTVKKGQTNANKNPN